MSDRIKRLLVAETQRHTETILDIVEKDPDGRAAVAFGVLGGAVALCDSFGLDVEGFIAHLRATHPMPPVLVPTPKGRAS